MSINRYLATLNGTKGVELISFLNKKQKPLSREEVSVQFSNEYNNISDPWIKENVDEIWAAQTKENQRIYNASKFRFAGVTFPTDVDNVTLNIGLTSYKDLMATNCHSFGEKLKDYGLEKYGNSSSCLSHALGVGSLLLTSDKQFLFMKRALWTGEDKGKLDRPGGHPEPDNVTGETKKSLDVKNEIFDSVLHEIRDEINLSVDTLTEPLLLGVVQSLDRLGRPSAEFLVRCSLSSQEVEARYLLNSQSEADESTGIIFLSEEQIRYKNLSESTWKSLTDAACGAIELYHEWHGYHL